MNGLKKVHKVPKNKQNQPLAMFLRKSNKAIKSSLLQGKCKL